MLGQTYSNILPHTFPPDTLPIVTTLYNPNLSGAADTKGGGTVLVKSQVPVANVSIDVAGLVVSALGLPADTLNGSFAGFDYTVLSASTGLAIDARYRINLTPGPINVRYDFTQAVKAFSGGDDPPVVTKSVTNENDSGMVFEATGTTLGIKPSLHYKVSGNVSLDAIVSVPVDVRVLEVNGNGLSLGPLAQVSTTYDLGAVPLFSTPVSFDVDEALPPITLLFDPGHAPPDPCQQHCDDGYVKKTYVTDFGTTEKYLPVFNYGVFGCDSVSLIRCIYGPDDAAYELQVRNTRAGSQYGTDLALAR